MHQEPESPPQTGAIAVVDTAVDDVADTAEAAEVSPGCRPARRRPAVAREHRGAEIRRGLRDSMAAGLGMIPIGVAFGMLVVQAGLPAWMAPALSLAGFAGSLELLLVGMIVDVVPLATIALTTLLVNFRHVFYPVSFPLSAVRHPVAKAYSVYAMIDEAYAVTSVNPREWTAWRLVSMQLAFQAYWVGGGLLGLAISTVIPGKIEGLDFAMCALFVTLTLDAVRTRRQVPSLLLAAVSFAIAIVLVPSQALFAAMILFLMLLIVRHWLTGRSDSSPEDSSPSESGRGLPGGTLPGATVSGDDARRVDA